MGNRSVQQLALRYRAGTLLGAASARCAAELGARYGGNVPATEIEAVTAQFSAWLQAACKVTRPAPAKADE